jgi:D-alanyl-D-alanine carboxypeptidase
MGRTDLPRGTGLPSPAVHGYAPDPPASPEDVTEVVAAGWSWASGGVTSTPRDMTRFVRGYARGATTDAATRRSQFRFIDGHSEPTGPGVNSAGLGIFRYETKCGTVFGHTGNTLGYTNFIAASRNGGRSATVTINSQVTPKNDPERFPGLRRIFGLAVCAAMAGRG